MNVRIRPGGIALFILALAALIYRLLYTLLWEQENDKGPLLSLFAKKPAVIAPAASPATSLPTVPAIVPATAKPLTDWLVLGPIPISAEAPRDEAGKISYLIDTRQLPDESNLRPRVAEAVRVGNTNLKWVAVKNRSLDLVAASKLSANKPGVETTNVAAYAVVTVEVPRAIRNATLYAGSDDGLAIWLNGTKLHRSAAARAVHLGDDKVVGFTLVEGHNVLVFKVAQGSGTWGLEASLDIPAK